MSRHSRCLWLALLALLIAAPGPALPNALADGGLVTLPGGGNALGAALDTSTGKIYVSGQGSIGTLVGSVLANGDLNTGFGGGVVQTRVAAIVSNYSGYDDSHACVVQPDGKVVSGGYYYEGKPCQRSYGFSLVRYNPNGTLDTSFNPQYDKKGHITGGGIVKTCLGTGSTMNGWINALALQGTKILVTGIHPSRNVVVARYTATGQLDTTFGSGGIVQTTIRGDGMSIALHNNGTETGIVVGARQIAYANPIVRFHADGTLDTSFGAGGVAPFAVPDPPSGAETDLSAIAIDPVDRSIVATGRYSDGLNYYVALTRFTEYGQLDPAFVGDGDGYTTFRPEAGQPWADYTPESVAVDASGRIVVAGNSTYDRGATTNVLVARFDEFGHPDADFNGWGYAEDFVGDAHAMFIQPDGKIVAAGTITNRGTPTTYTIFIVRYLPTGEPDLSF